MRTFLAVALWSFFIASSSAELLCDKPGYFWFVSDAPAEKILQSGDKKVEDFLASCRTVLGGANSPDGRRSFPYLEKLGANHRAIYQSFYKFQEDIASGRISPRIKVVVYNPEPGFKATTDAEKRAPIDYAKKFGELAKSKGYVAVAAPSCRLVKYKARAREKFMRCGDLLLSPMAPYFDFIDIQAQAFQSNADLYKKIVTAAVASIRKSSPNTKVVAQISTASMMKGEAEVVATAASSVADIVDGYWLNIENNEKGRSNAVTAIRDELSTLNTRKAAATGAAR